MTEKLNTAALNSLKQALYLQQISRVTVFLHTSTDLPAHPFFYFVHQTYAAFNV